MSIPTEPTFYSMTIHMCKPSDCVLALLASANGTMANTLIVEARICP